MNQEITELDGQANVAEETKQVSLELTNVSRSFLEGKNSIEVLREINLSVNSGESVALTGPSGAGKSTLLQIAGLLDRPNSGEIYLSGHACSKANDKIRTQMRREYIGFVYQFHHLLPEFTAQENIALPQMINGINKDDAMVKSGELLESLSLENRANHRPAELSGGERQRVAIARAVANSPTLLLADEPTGNLDLKTSEQVFETLSVLVQSANLTAVVATHNMDLAEKMDRRITLSEGQLLESN